MSVWRSRRCFLSTVLAALVVAALVAVLLLQPWANREPRAANQGGRFLRATVASNGYECASIGRGILEKHGTAVDAAIATLFCEGLSCAQCMGLGGGFLAMVYDAPTGRMRSLNARERAPLATTPDMYQNASSRVGGLAVAVPGELRGYGELYREYGRLPWADLVRPTIKLCKHGHRVTNYMGRVLQTYSDRIKEEPTMREIYVNPKTGEVWREGDLIKRPQLAKTLEVIAREGPEAIHNGSLTELLVQDIQDLGGIITAEDLRSYRVVWDEPIAVPVTEEHTLYSVPLPGSGSVLAFILNTLRGYVGDGTAVPTDSNLYWHRIVETFKYAYAKRTGLGDPNRGPLGDRIREIERNLSNPAWAVPFRSLIDDRQTYQDWHHYGALFEGADDHGTAHMVVVAPDGSAVSLTSTVNYIWGSQRRSPSLGFILNNEMDDFAIPDTTSTYGLPPSPANMLAPGLQPLSSMTPSIVLKDNQPALVIGAAGGTKITTQVSLIVRHTLLEGGELWYAMDRPRLHHQLMPMVVDYETNFNPEVLASLRARGHVTSELDATAGFAAVVGTIRGRDGYLHSHTDRRRGGNVDGL